MNISFDIASTPVGTRMLDDLVGAGSAGERSVADLSEADLYEFVTRAAVEGLCGEVVGVPPKTVALASARAD